MVLLLHEEIYHAKHYMQAWNILWHLCLFDVFTFIIFKNYSIYGINKGICETELYIHCVSKKTFLMFLAITCKSIAGFS